MADTGMSSLRGQPRRKFVTLTSSNAAVAIPSWAQDGKGIVRVTGCGGGASGSIGTTMAGVGGGGAGLASDYPMLIPAGTTTLAAVIGSAGAAVSGTSDTNGNAGGDTTLTVGSMVLRLCGGGNDPSVGGNLSSGGGAYLGPKLTFSHVSNGNPFMGSAATLTTNYVGISGKLLRGPDAPAQTNQLPFGAGAYSLFGAGGAGRASAGAGDGANATGYGAGGSGARYGSVAVTSGAGSPGMLLLEFVEGF